MPFSSEQIQCKKVVGASSVNLRSSRNVGGKAKVAYFGKDCEFVRLDKMKANPGCKNGDKFVLKRRPPVRKQLMILDNEPVLVFLKNGKEIPQCSPKIDVTSKVRILGVHLQQNPCNTSVLKQAFEYIRTDYEYIQIPNHLLTFVYSQIFLSV